MTVVEHLLASSMLVVVLTATFMAFNSFGSATRTNARQNHAQSVARSTADRIARELRRCVHREGFEALSWGGEVVQAFIGPVVPEDVA